MVFIAEISSMKCLISVIVYSLPCIFRLYYWFAFFYRFLLLSVLHSTSLFFCLLLRRIWGYEHTPRIFLPLCEIVKRLLDMLTLNMLNSNSMHIKFNAITKEEMRKTELIAKKMASKRREEKKNKRNAKTHQMNYKYVFKAILKENGLHSDYIIFHPLLRLASNLLSRSTQFHV